MNTYPSALKCSTSNCHPACLRSGFALIIMFIFVVRRWTTLEFGMQSGSRKHRYLIQMWKLQLWLFCPLNLGRQCFITHNRYTCTTPNAINAYFTACNYIKGDWFGGGIYIFFNSFSAFERCSKSTNISVGITLVPFCIDFICTPSCDGWQSI